MITAAAALHAPTLPPEPRLRRHLEELDELGYTRIRGFLDRATTAALRAYMDAHMPPAAPADQPSAKRRPDLRHPMPEAGLLAGMITDEHVALATALLDARDLRLLEQVCCRTDPMPGPPGPQGWHIDCVLFPRHDLARPRQVYHQLFHVLSDVRPGGAAFMIVPGSHKRLWAAAAAFANRTVQECYGKANAEVIAAAGIDLTQAVEVPADEGDLIVFSPMALHSASTNTRAESRYVFAQSFYDASAVELHALWESMWLRAGFPEPLRAALPERFQRLLQR